MFSTSERSLMRGAEGELSLPTADAAQACLSPTVARAGAGKPGRRAVGQARGQGTLHTSLTYLRYVVAE